MNVLDRYVATAVLKGVFLVMAVLISVGTVFEFMGQLPDVGTAQYTIRDAMAFVVLRIPRLVVRLLPAAALIGALVGLGNLAVQRELVVMRSSGVSLARLAGSVASAGVVLMIVMALLGESLAPSMSYTRTCERALLDTGNSVGGPRPAKARSLVTCAGKSRFGFARLPVRMYASRLTHIANADTPISTRTAGSSKNYAGPCLKARPE